MYNKMYEFLAVNLRVSASCICRSSDSAYATTYNRANPDRTNVESDHQTNQPAFSALERCWFFGRCAPFPFASSAVVGRQSKPGRRSLEP